jgi:hypothetical protein
VADGQLGAARRAEKKAAALAEGEGKRDRSRGRRARWLVGEAAESDERRSPRASGPRPGRSATAAEGSRAARRRTESAVRGGGGCCEEGAVAGGDIAGDGRRAADGLDVRAGSGVGFSLAFPVHGRKKAASATVHFACFSGCEAYHILDLIISFFSPPSSNSRL